METVVRKRGKRQGDQDGDTVLQLREMLGAGVEVPEAISFSKGREIEIGTNVYRLSVSRAAHLYKYRVDMEPEVLNPRLTTHFLYTAVCGKDAGPMSGNDRWRRIIYDGRYDVYTTLGDLEGEYDVVPRGASEDKKIKVKIGHAHKLLGGDLEPLLQIYNMAFHRGYRVLGLSSFRQKWIDDTDKKQAGSFLISRGFVPSVVSLSSGMNLVVDIASRIDRSGTLLDFLREGIRNEGRRRELEQACRSLQLVTTHLAKKNRSVVVNRFFWDRRPSEYTFSRKDRNGGVTEISIKDYYYEVYNRRVEEDDILVGMSSKGNDGERVTVYPASVIKPTGITDAERKSPQVMRDIATVTRITAQERRQRLDKFISDLRGKEENRLFFEEWGIEINNSEPIVGRVIPSPKMTMNGQGSKTPQSFGLGPDLSFKRELRSHGLSMVPEYKRPCLIVFPRSLQEQVERQMISAFEQVATGLGVVLPRIERAPIDTVHSSGYIDAIVRFSQSNGPIGFCICLLPDNDKHRYGELKTFLTVEIGLHSQFLIARTLGNKDFRSVATNIVIQIVSKTGGVPYHISGESLPLDHTILMGIAVSHTYGSGGVAAVTGSYDWTMTRYTSETGSVGAEKAADGVMLEDFVVSLFGKFKKTNGYDARRLVVYRDGVSYGGMKYLKTVEIAAIERGLKRYVDESGSTEGEISLVYMVAQKRASIRIMATNGGVMSNAAAGTVVTEKVNASKVAEFYLVSHHANQGCATPTRYTILHHTPPGKWEDDQLIMLTHYMTLQYYNWSGSIRVPGCLMLASRLAEYCQSHLGMQSAHENLKNYLYFL